MKKSRFEQLMKGVAEAAAFARGEADLAAYRISPPRQQMSPVIDSEPSPTNEKSRTCLDSDI